MTREEAITALGDRNNLLWGMSKEEQKYYSEALDMAISALSENKTQIIDKSNFDAEQYKTDLQSAYDCGYNQACKDKIVSPYKAESEGT